MSKIVMLPIMLFVYIIGGAAEISLAMHNFEKERYFRFGFWIMLAMCMILGVARLMLIS